MQLAAWADAAGSSEWSSWLREPMQLGVGGYSKGRVDLHERTYRPTRTVAKGNTFGRVGVCVRTCFLETKVF